MREHRYTLDLPHARERVWTLMQDYPRWAEYAPMVLRVDVVYPGDERGNGLLRRVLYQMPFGRTGSALELVRDVDPGSSYRFTMLSREPGNDQTARIALETLGPSKTRLHFEERYHLTKAPWRWFEGPIYRFINRKNEETMRAMSDWLTAHPEYPSGAPGPPAHEPADSPSEAPGRSDRVGS